MKKIRRIAGLDYNAVVTARNIFFFTTMLVDSVNYSYLPFQSNGTSYFFKGGGVHYPLLHKQVCAHFLCVEIKRRLTFDLSCPGSGDFENTATTLEI